MRDLIPAFRCLKDCHTEARRMLTEKLLSCLIFQAIEGKARMCVQQNRAALAFWVPGAPLSALPSSCAAPNPFAPTFFPMLPHPTFTRAQCGLVASSRDPCLPARPCLAGLLIYSNKKLLLKGAASIHPTLLQHLQAEPPGTLLPETLDPSSTPGPSRLFQTWNGMGLETCRASPLPELLGPSMGESARARH